MRLLSIELNDFQVHEKTTIEFAPTITTIKGATDAGKSAIIRALRWACLNDLTGDEFIREGAAAKRTKIILRIRHDKKDWEVLRYKSVYSTGVNTYELNGQEFKAFGMNVPLGIAQLLQLSEINFQSQHDSPFWFSETAGEVSRKLNSIVDLSIIDTTLSNIASAVRQAQERKNVSSERLKEAQEELEKVKDAETRIQEFRNVKEAYGKRTETETAYNRLAFLINDVNTRRGHLKRNREREEDSQQIFDSCKQSMDLEKKVTRLGEIVARGESWQRRSVAPPDFAPVTEAFDKWQETLGRVEALSALVGDTKGMAAAVKELDSKASNAEKKFHQETKGKRCPLCGKIS